MDEVDAYIEQQCRNLECSFVADGGSSGVDFDTKNVFEFLVRCIWKINPSSKNEIPSYQFPRHLPTRFRQATAISEQLKLLGVRGDIGFQNLLYGSRNSLRNVFIEVIHKLPSGLEVLDEPGQKLNPAIQIGVDELKKDPRWVPQFCRRLQMNYDGRFWCPGDEYPELFPLNSTGSIWLEQHATDPRHLIVQYLLQNTESADKEVDFSGKKRERPSLPPKPARLTSSTPEETAKSDELEALRSSLEHMIQKLSAKQNDFALTKMKLNQLRTETSSNREKSKGFDERLVQALKDPKFFRNEMIMKIEEITSKSEVDSDAYLQARTEANQQLEDVMKQFNITAVELKKKTLREEIADRIATIERLRVETRNDEEIVPKMKMKLTKIAEETFSKMERRCRDIEDLIKRQEKQLAKTKSERKSVVRRCTRGDEAFERMGEIIQNHLSIESERYKVKKALRLFLRLQLRLVKIEDLIKHSGILKAAIHEAVNKIDNEKDREAAQLERHIDEDIMEIEAENKSITENIQKIQAR